MKLQFDGQGKNTLFLETIVGAMVKTQQLEMVEMLEPDAFWVEIVAHGVFPVGTRFLVVQEFEDHWMRCWRDGVPPEFRANGTLLMPEHVREV